MSSGTKRTILIILVILIFAALVGLGLLGKPILWQPTPPPHPDPRQPVHPTARVLEGAVQPPARLPLRAPVGGKIVALGASEGRAVMSGQLVAQVESAVAREQLARAKTRLKEVQRQVSTVDTAATTAKLQETNTRLQRALQVRTAARQALDEYKQQHPEVPELANNLRTAVKSAREAQAEVRRLNAAIKAAQRRAPDPKDLTLLTLRYKMDTAYQKATSAAGQVSLLRQQAGGRRDQFAKLAALEAAYNRAHRVALDCGKESSGLRRSTAGQAVLRGDGMLKQAQAKVTEAEDVLAACAVKAQTAGELCELRVRPGSIVEAGQTIALIEEGGGDRLICRAAAGELAGLVVGQEAQVRPQVGAAFAAAVSQLVPSSEAVLVYLVPLGRASLPARGTAVVAELAARRHGRR